MDLLLRTVLEPLFTRVGTIAGTYLVAYGMASQHEVTVAQAITAVLLFGVDLGTRRWVRRRHG